MGTDWPLMAIMRQLRMPPEDGQNVSLFGSQCLHRIEVRCTPRGDDTCERSHREQRCRNCGKNCWIERLDLIEQVAHQPAGCQACCKSHHKTEDRGSHSI